MGLRVKAGQVEGVPARGQEGWELDEFEGPFQSKPFSFYTSITYCSKSSQKDLKILRFYKTFKTKVVVLTYL